MIGNRGIYTKIYFPRIFIPLSPIIAGLVDLIISLSLVFVLMFIYGISPTINIIWIPLLIAIMVVTTSGMGFWLSALAVQYRDIKHAITFNSIVDVFCSCRLASLNINRKIW